MMQSSGLSAQRHGSQRTGARSRLLSLAKLSCLWQSSRVEGRLTCCLMSKSGLMTSIAATISFARAVKAVIAMRAKNHVEPSFLYVADIMKLFNCSRSKAYQIIAELNRELEQKGFLFIRGRISRRYFAERYGA